MRLISLLSMVVLSGCSTFELFVDDVKDALEINQKMIHEVHHNERTVLCIQEPWKCEDAKEDREKFEERMKNYSDYYHYHFTPYIA